MDNMDKMDKMTEYLTKLSEPLGTTVEHLWGVVVKQAPIDGAINIVQFAILICWAAILLRLTKQMARGVYNDEKYALLWIAVIGGWFFTVILLLVAFFSIPDTTAAFVNPEYWALEHILNKISCNQ